MIKLLITSVVVAMLVGCASPATQQSMSVALQDLPSRTNPALKGQMSVGSVTGGKETNPMWTSQVDAQTFKGALDKSVAMAGYKAGDASAAKYRVDAHLNELSQPMFGLTFDVVSTVLYTVTFDGKPKQFPVTATGTATGSDAFVGVERLRIANERSIKENLKQFLQKISDQISW
jgi:hypothetical protein